MSENVCAVCQRRMSAHTIEDVQKCSSEFSVIELERTANEECISCGDPGDVNDPVTGDYYCHGCFAWISQLNDEGK